MARIQGIGIPSWQETSSESGARFGGGATEESKVGGYIGGDGAALYLKPVVIYLPGSEYTWQVGGVGRHQCRGKTLCMKLCETIGGRNACTRPRRFLVISYMTLLTVSQSTSHFIWNSETHGYSVTLGLLVTTGRDLGLHTTSTGTQAARELAKNDRGCGHIDTWL
ncbi:uncharacterized protein FOMMEDRAFT_155776 [Fomitiporia mediterranea MF3/22]|uniref:uncharacterized protein n=1 Tax=Fomitiporia mediterranea (strain MF3/22) TaxID=694068 RepID=UPI0004408E5F|nr:uncharacterized protein FOMMEDRAFT_155776 [Fomitiporia mediterranea MF3/22]EJD04623.1 hypothetical protein FOMMEDRAFT_155776 [Fomitiporia mediterranea MF3/22]